MPFRSPALTAWGVWDRFLHARPDAGFMQGSWWAHFRAAAGSPTFAAIVRRKGMIIGGGVVQRTEWRPGEAYYSLPDGPVLPEAPDRAREVFEALLRTVRQHRHGDPLAISHLRMAPRWTERPEFLAEFDITPAPDDTGMPPRHTRYVDLRGSETGILAQMPPKGRYDVAVARRHGITVVEDPSPRGIADLLALTENGSVREGFPPILAEHLVTALPSLSAVARASLLFAQLGPARLAAALVFYFGIRGTAFFSAASDAHRDLMAPALLQFEGMRHAKGRGCEAYDLWGVAPTDAPEDPLHGATEFKLKLGGERVTLVPTLDLIFDRDAYARYLGVPPAPMTERPGGMYVE